MEDYGPAAEARAAKRPKLAGEADGSRSSTPASDASLPAAPAAPVAVDAAVRREPIDAPGSPLPPHSGAPAAWPAEQDDNAEAGGATQDVSSDSEQAAPDSDSDSEAEYMNDDDQDDRLSAAALAAAGPAELGQRNAVLVRKNRALRERVRLLEGAVESFEATISTLSSQAGAGTSTGCGSGSGRGTTLSPAMYTVTHDTKEVRTQRLGRTASIATRNELSKLTRASKSALASEEQILLERITGLVRPDGLEKNSAYLRSTKFATDLIELCSKAAAAFSRDDRVLELASPMYIFGDLHGNMRDLQFFAQQIWPMGMRLTAGSFLFLGDYVDRGAHGLELVAYLFAQKVAMPDKVTLIRGNHETRSCSSWEAFYGAGSFIAQCRERFGQPLGYKVWEACNQAFDCLPLAAIVDQSIFCVHGGIPKPLTASQLTSKAVGAAASPTKGSSAATATSISSSGGGGGGGGGSKSESSSGQSQSVTDGRIQAIRELPCPLDISPPAPGSTDANNTLAFSLLWADPADSEQETAIKRTSSTGFGDNARGGSTVVFGNRAVGDFLEANKLNYIMRAHEATSNGVAVCKNARVLTVFSTSTDHGFNGDATCGCCLVDRNKIQAIIRGSGAEDGGMVEAGFVVSEK